LRRSDLFVCSAANPGIRYITLARLFKRIHQIAKPPAQQVANAGAAEDCTQVSRKARACA
jgi:hypothetical protein